MRAWFATLVLSVLAMSCNAEGTLFKVPTRDGVTTTLFLETVPNAKATVLLFPGGAGGFGKVEDGKAMGIPLHTSPYDSHLID